MSGSGLLLCKLNVDPISPAIRRPERRLYLAFRAHLKANLDVGSLSFRSPLTPRTGNKKTTKPLVAQVIIGGKQHRALC
jgi:hypothetical protein